MKSSNPLDVDVGGGEEGDTLGSARAVPPQGDLACSSWGATVTWAAATSRSRAGAAPWLWDWVGWQLWPRQEYRDHTRDTGTTGGLWMKFQFAVVLEEAWRCHGITAAAFILSLKPSYPFENIFWLNASTDYWVYASVTTTYLQELLIRTHLEELGLWRSRSPKPQELFLMPFRRAHNTSSSWDLFLWAAWCRCAQSSHLLSRALFWGRHGHVWSSHSMGRVSFPGLFLPPALRWAIWVYLHWPLSCAGCVFRNESFLFLKVVIHETTSSFAITLLLNEISSHPTISEEKKQCLVGGSGSCGVQHKFYYFTQFVLLTLLSLHIYLPSIPNKLVFSALLCHKDDED